MLIQVLSNGASETIKIAVITAFSAIASPFLLSYLQGRQRKSDKQQEADIRHQEKEEDNRRLDEVARRAELVVIQAKEAAEKVGEVALQAKEAADKVGQVASKAEEAASLLAERQDVASEKADRLASTIVETSKVQSGKLDQIHSLANSLMTARMGSELGAHKDQLILMLEMEELRRDAGKEPTKELLDAKEAKKKLIAELEAQLRDRETQTKIAAEHLAEVEAGKKEPKTSVESKAEEK